ncbi:hypothetical protein FQA39_LY03516 [Lamprigera yunnana]|nr:hypothetical protein FQA39_LY03516 [Lamprigera yunnana]
MYTFLNYNNGEGEKMNIVRKLHVVSSLGKAYLPTAIVETAVNGFRKSGISPFKPDVFLEADFSDRNQDRPNQVTDNEKSKPRTSNPVFSPQDIRKVPAIEKSTSKRRGTALLVTETPHKHIIQAAPEKKRKVNGPKNQKRKQTRRNLSADFYTAASSELAAPGSSKTTNVPRKVKKKTVNEFSSEDETTEIHYVSTDVNCPF